MDSGILGQIGIGSSLGLAAVGSAVGVCVAGLASVGAWKKCFVQNKPAPFILVAFAGAPLTQTIYGFILMQTLAGALKTASPEGIGMIGIFGGLGLGASSIAQGMCAAVSSDAYAETGQGFGNYMLVIGLCETVSLFAMVFSMLIVGSL